MRAKLRIIYISQIIVAFHFLGFFGAIAQSQSNDYSGLSLKLICSNCEIVAGQNVEFQIVISNSAQRIGIALPLFMDSFNLIIQQGGTNIPYRVTHLRSGYEPPDLEIEANGTWVGGIDLYAGYPLGLREGNFALFATYSPSKTDTSFKIWSNPAKLTVLRRSPEQEEQYNYYQELLNFNKESHVQQALQFLATYTNSIFEPMVRLNLARIYMSPPYRDNDSAIKTLEVVPLLPAATKYEVGRKHGLASRALKEQGYLYEAFAELKTSPIPFPDHEIKAWKRKLAMLYLQAQVRLEPEALKVSPGILTAHVRLPEGYPVSGITTATCDHAAAERMMLSDDGTEMIMKFRRQDIESAQARIGKNIDTNFVVQGNWQGEGKTKYFWGTASIKKIVETKDEDGEKDEDKDKDKSKDEDRVKDRNKEKDKGKDRDKKN